MSDRGAPVSRESEVGRFVVGSGIIAVAGRENGIADREGAFVPILNPREATVTKIAADIVDAYVFRRHNGMVQFLLLQRQKDVALGGTWHGVHGKIDPGETALEAATRAVLSSTGLKVTTAYSADYINQFFDPQTDSIILAPVFAFKIDQATRINLSEEFVDYAWCEMEEATSRLLFSGQRWAVRHIEEVIGLGGDEAEYYRIQ